LQKHLVKQQEKKMESRINNIFSNRLVIIKENDSVATADALMEAHQIRHLPVVSADDTLVGIISRTDYAAFKKTSIALDDIKVKQLMSSPVKVFSADAKVRAVAQYFVAQKLSSGLVMENGEIAGIVTTEDLMKLLAKSESLKDEAERLDLLALADEDWISATSLN
jgi:CBS domain-containing protein